jgi:hypothetical protein
VGSRITRRAASTALAAGAAGLAAALGVAILSPAAGASTAGSTVGDSCVVGSWTTGTLTFFTEFRHVAVMMTGLEGTRQTTDATGRSVTVWDQSRPATSYLFGHKLREVVGGSAVAHLHGSVREGMMSDSGNVARHVTETYTYRHHTYVHHLSGPFSGDRGAYTCTATQLTTSTGTSTRDG